MLWVLSRIASPWRVSSCATSCALAKPGTRMPAALKSACCGQDPVFFHESIIKTVSSILFNGVLVDLWRWWFCSCRMLSHFLVQAVWSASWDGQTSESDQILILPNTGELTHKTRMLQWLCRISEWSPFWARSQAKATFRWLLGKNEPTKWHANTYSFFFFWGGQRVQMQLKPWSTATFS